MKSIENKINLIELLNKKFKSSNKANKNKIKLLIYNSKNQENKIEKIESQKILNSNKNFKCKVFQRSYNLKK